MADFNSSLPVRTENNGDVRVFIADSTTPSQLNSVDTFGSLSVLLKNAAGTATTSQVNGSQQALDVGINVAGVQIDPRQIRALTAADVITAQQGTSPWITKDQADGPVTPGTVASFSQLIGGQYNTVLPTLTNGQQSAVQVDSSGRLLVNTSNTDDHNFGTVGANTLRTAAQIGNATGAADFNFGTAGAQTLRVASLIGNATGSANFNFGTVGAQTLRVASQIGNATGAADFNAGATGAQTLRVEANQGAPTSVGNSWPIKVTDGVDIMAVNTDGSINVVVADNTPGTPINDYKTAAAVAANASDNHDYTVTALKTFYLNQIEASASAKAKIEVEIETGVATGTFLTKWVKFNSTADPNMSIHIDNPIAVAAGVRVRIVVTNKDNQAQDLYSTISGYELP